MESREKALSYIITGLLEGARDLELLKREAGKKFKCGFFNNAELMEAFPKRKLTPGIRALLKRKPMRTLSGVAPIAVMIKPENSCRWNCIYCPFTGKAPRSYTGSEPAALRARSNSFSPGRQVRSRLRQFELNGHPTDKCDLIVMGGTFLSMDERYKRAFVKGIYDGLNGSRSRDLEKAKKLNESAKHRAVGLTFETRPDVCTYAHIDEMLVYGATKVELGVQHPSDSIYGRISRGHRVSDVIQATARLKDSAFKVAYHIMPGLPGSSPAKDLLMFKRLFSSPDFRPDMLKIYPTLVIPGTKLHQLMLAGQYEPYSTETAADVIARAYSFIPKYVRVMRVQRDIPANLIAGGVKKSNLRELVERKASSLGIVMNEMRSREAGLNRKIVEEPVLRRLEYDACKGKEIFLSMEDRKSNALAAFLRLRIPGSHRKEITEESALVRELHVYGQEAELGKKAELQHRGLGSALLFEAERIASDLGARKMLVISAVGVKPYYRRRGYSDDGPYLSKPLGGD
ncbi:MAG: tRNA uridine(34) 5-carboxymethylaminomethyl modification radical SAM/GNAT enzyme Elp3 [Candidatus ainarchaeum sp.]|nr:tRNA uridine(34) 5-carboxymethylaminomethyl modification radical SAM/GNAT enzyme Elp3 [Candidatus ainarchaeum sp.]